MNIMENVGHALTGISCGLGLFIVCCMWVIFEEEIKAWWKRRKEKDG